MAIDRQAAERRGHNGESLAALWLQAQGLPHPGPAAEDPCRRDRPGGGRALWPGLLHRGQGARPRPGRPRNRSAPAQQTRIARAASLYLAGRPALARRGARFDIVAIGPAACRCITGMCGGPRFEQLFKGHDMALTVAIQMDPIEKIDIGGDSTFALALEAQKPRSWPALLRPARSFLPRRQGHRAMCGR